MATTIKEVLDTLSDKDRKLLSYAFEHDLAQIVELPDRKYIGINADRLPNVTPDLMSGSWSVGQIK